MKLFRRKKPIDKKVYTDSIYPSHDWFEWWSKSELEIWQRENGAEWLNRPGAPNFEVGADVIGPVEPEYDITPVPRRANDLRELV